MPRDLPLGNGHLLVAFDLQHHLCDVFFPKVGMENQTDGRMCRLGFWRDGVFAWFPDDGFEIVECDYEEHTLVARVHAHSPRLGISVELKDAVDSREDVLLRRIRIESMPTGGQTPAPDGPVRVFWHHDLCLRGTSVGDCAFYDPDLFAVVHYKADRYLLVGGQASGQGGIERYAVGVTGIHGLEGTWRDAEDGELGQNPVAQGAVDSVVSLTVDPGEEAWAWLCLGRSLEEVAHLQQRVREKTPDELMRRTRDYWRLWVSTSSPDESDLSDAVWRLYRRSLLIARTQIDDGGAVLASGDWDTARFGRDTYTYTWARDGAFTVDALSRAGFHHAAARFFQFCADAMTPAGYLAHKYNPDGTPGSTWHPKVMAGRPVLPIQEDETALVLWALWRYFERTRSVEDARAFYSSIVLRAANFLSRYRDPATGLPRPSHDLWEERRGVSTFTVASVYAALMAASQFAEAFGEDTAAARYLAAALEVRQGAHQHLVDPANGRIVRMAEVDPATDRIVGLDGVADASLFGMVPFGLFDEDDPRLIRTLAWASERLWVPGPVGGMARYDGDLYWKSPSVDEVPGNPWFIATLWRAEWEIARSKQRADLEGPRQLIDWVVRHALPSGVLAEQVSPVNHGPLSVSPLTWSHAAFVQAVLTYVERYQELA